MSAAGAKPPPRFSLVRLEWSDPPLGEIPLSARPLVLSASFGSGLARRAGDPEGHVWAVGDRGPNHNDFGVEGAETSFWKLSFDAPVFA